MGDENNGKIEYGMLLERVDNIGIVVVDMQRDIKTILTSQSSVQERLQQGTKHFDMLDGDMKAVKEMQATQTIKTYQHEQLIDHINKEGCNSEKHSLKGVYIVVGIGFTVLAFLISFFSLRGGS